MNFELKDGFVVLGCNGMGVGFQFGLVICDLRIFLEGFLDEGIDFVQFFLEFNVVFMLKKCISVVVVVFCDGEGYVVYCL